MRPRRSPDVTRYSAQIQRSAALGLRARAEDAPLGLLDRDVVDARLAAAHVALVVELPLLVAVAAPPLPRRVATLVLEAHGDPVAAERPQVLAQRVVELALPLARQELDDRGAAGEELVAVAPLRILAVGGGDALGVARVPRVLGRLHLLARGLLGERWDGRSHRRSVPGRWRTPRLARAARRRRPAVVLGRHAQRVHRALLGLPGQAPVQGHEDVAPERAAGRAARGGRDVRMPGAQLVHRREPEVQLGLLAQALLRARDPGRQPDGLHAGTADAGFGAAAAPSEDAGDDGGRPALRSSASPFCAAIAIGSNSAPIGGE